MKAVLLLDERLEVAENAFVDITIWRVPAPVRGSTHHFKYRLALVRIDVCVMRYDNEAGKGDHKHLREVEIGYAFSGLDRLQTDFWNDVAEWKQK